MRTRDSVLGRLIVMLAIGTMLLGSGPLLAVDYSRFNHNSSQHARLTCLLCHRRSDNSAAPRLPGHTPCAGCHAPQFADSRSPICTICHTSAGSAEIRRFPRLRSFNMVFDHAGHATGAARSRSGCTACHKPERRGVAYSIPSGVAAHNLCYQCHTPRAESAGRDISSCATCHRDGSYRRATTGTRAYRVGFSHASHGARQGLNCASCHQVRAGMPRPRGVSEPVVNQHFSTRALSCMSCHDGRRAFGGDDFKSCGRCHKGASFSF